MTKKSKLILCFATGIALILLMGYLLFKPDQTNSDFGFILLLGASFLLLLKKISQIKNEPK
ncbi:hypothetical protein [Acinetobacter lwoffii]|uniref:hypothetical protein n=1 Tax=Acinetobacter lwoffii TaxID=28090 RepID=UPI003BF80974